MPPPPPSLSGNQNEDFSDVRQRPGCSGARGRDVKTKTLGSIPGTHSPEKVLSAKRNSKLLLPTPAGEKAGDERRSGSPLQPLPLFMEMVPSPNSSEAQQHPYPSPTSLAPEHLSPWISDLFLHLSVRHELGLCEGQAQQPQGRDPTTDTKQGKANQVILVPRCV